MLNYLFWLLSITTILLAYPVDYDSEQFNKALAALAKLSATITANPFPNLVQDYNNEISPVNIKAYNAITAKYNTFNQHVKEIQTSAEKVDADVTECLGNMDIAQPIDLYEKYTQECVTPARVAGLGLTTAGYNVFDASYRKYSELMDYFMGCISGGDPAPHICAGAAQYAYLEALRVLPEVAATPFKVQVKLRQQIEVLSECANEYIAGLSKKLQIEFFNVQTCMQGKINLL